MKKLFILLVLISFKSISFGQFTTITPKIGFTLSNCKDFEDTKYKPGYVLGASTLYRLSPKFAIKPELLMEQKGFMSKIVFTDWNGRPTGTATSAVTWNYLVLPVQFRYSFF